MELLWNLSAANLLISVQKILHDPAFLGQKKKPFENIMENVR